MTAINISDNIVFVQFPSINAQVQFSQYSTSFYAEAYIGKSFGPKFHYRFQSLEKAFEYIEKWVNSCESHKENILKNRAERAEKQKNYKHDFVVGDIFYTSWGYDQTNLDFYQVISTPTSKTIILSRIAQKTSYEGHMNGEAMPAKDKLVGDSFSKRVCVGDYVKIKGQYAHKWDGKPKFFSSWA